MKRKIRYMTLSLSKVKEDLVHIDGADRDQMSCLLLEDRTLEQFSLFIVFNSCGSSHNLLYVYSSHKQCFIDNKYLLFFFLFYTYNPYQSLIWLLTYNLYLCLVFMLCFVFSKPWPLPGDCILCPGTEYQCFKLA